MRVLASLLLAALAASGCARVPAISDHLPEKAPVSVELTGVPFFPQERYQCGPAALATVLTWSGEPVTAEALVPRVYLPAREGSLQPELRATARAHDRLAYEPEPRLRALLAELDDGHPVLVLQNLGLGRWPVWHYAVVIGYDADAGQFILRSGTTEREVLSTRRFLTTWVRADAWAMVVLPPGQLPASADVERYVRAAADLERTGSAEAAAKAWHAATERWPDLPAAWFGLANTRHATGDTAAAVTAWREALLLDPGHVPAHHNLARAYLGAGCPEHAMRHVRLGHEHLDRLPGMRAPLARIEAEVLAASDNDANCAFN